MPRLENLALERLPAADEIPHALLRLGRDPDHRQLARAVRPRQLDRIVRVVLPLHAGLGRDERRRNHIARHAPRGAGTVQQTPEKLANSLFDSYQVAIATKIDVLLTNDSKMREIYAETGAFLEVVYGKLGTEQS